VRGGGRFARGVTAPLYRVEKQRSINRRFYPGRALRRFSISPRRAPPGCQYIHQACGGGRLSCGGCQRGFPGERSHHVAFRHHPHGFTWL